jgi:hypothetical protein
VNQADSTVKPNVQEQERVAREQEQARLLNKWRATRRSNPAAAMATLQTWANLWREERNGSRRSTAPKITGG